MPGYIKRVDFEKALKALGYAKVGIKGDHIKYKIAGKRSIIFTIDREIPIAHIHTNLKTMGINLSELMDCIAEVTKKKGRIRRVKNPKKKK